MKSICKLILAIMICISVAYAQDPGPANQNNGGHRHTIVSISVCGAPHAGSAAGSCAPGSMDSAQPVLAPGGIPINTYGNMATLADEHSTIFGPRTLPGHHGDDYLFFVATRTSLNSISSGVVVLTGGSGPDAGGRWTLDFSPNFGLYPPTNQHGQIFLSAMDHDLCPTVTHAAGQDQTYDLNYADPGSVLVDPTNLANKGAGGLLMIYEGTTRCIGIPKGDNGANNFYSTTAVATSLDQGVDWPSYRSNWVPLPGQNSLVGPLAPLGAVGPSVCMGNDCSTPAPNTYGRYPVLSAPVTIGDAMSILGGVNLASNMGDSQPAAFIDDVGANRNDDEGDTGAEHGKPNPYVYVVNVYNPGPAALGPPALSNGQTFDLVIARAQLNGGTAPLKFQTWYGGSFSEPGLGSDSGGLQDPILPISSTDPAAFGRCEDPSENRVMGSISFVEETQQYLLTFVCTSPSDPGSATVGPGGAWFYSTMDATRFDLSHQDQWSSPQEIAGSWSAFGTGGACIQDFNGWYPSFMSLRKDPGHLSTNGYVFHMQGCTGKVSSRQFSSRAFTITTN